MSSEAGPSAPPRSPESKARDDNVGLVEHLIAASAHNHGHGHETEHVDGQEGGGQEDGGGGQANGADLNFAAPDPSNDAVPQDDAARIKNLEDTVQMLRERLAATEEKVDYLRQELDSLYAKRSDAQQVGAGLPFLGFKADYDSSFVNGSGSGALDGADRRKRSSEEEDKTGAGGGSMKKKKPRTATERKVVSVRKAFADWLCERFGIPRTSQSKEFPLYPGDDDLPKDSTGQPFMRIDWVQDSASPTSDQTQALITQAVSDFITNPIAHRLEPDDLRDTDEVKRHCLHRYQLIRDNAITRQNGGTIPSRPSRMSLGGGGGGAGGGAVAPAQAHAAHTHGHTQHEAATGSMAGPPGQTQSQDPAPPPPFEIPVTHGHHEGALDGSNADGDVKHGFDASQHSGGFVGVSS